ncbi:MAG: hypothetical protein A3A31_02215 [Candidatus Zambryskibacteria bacterium RIFCSPLOWO2_01_FULL_48_25]|uniref:Uncharacterized protein n=1 Tax=Candidatus Zambryskibacteria bacterium RIFCSPHIGHO2_01_FULL_46_25 TaxID=1802738 RepID=A0A1G2T074_9BACT|nr:MAG: hypothetical protein A2838_03075 [Candidatus Zambryskibacteria bacterium RIFCSPHIGHO2_01_FULL_46_25]OHB07317.1 MAG: hypothetical protein A3A31_02215 [Candidatus Zambryskibacteria bacterium RIFCSPLOWO2_01_FULL_48_25]
MFKRGQKLPETICSRCNLSQIDRRRVTDVEQKHCNSCGAPLPRLLITSSPPANPPKLGPGAEAIRAGL